MKKNLLNQGIIGCIIFLFFTASATAVTQQSSTTDKTGTLEIKTFTPTDDSFVTPLDEVNGDLPDLNIRNGGIGNAWYSQPVIKFDLSSLTPDVLIKSAKLNLYYYDYSDTNPAGRPYNAYQLEGDWNEETIYGGIVPPCSSVISSVAVAPSFPASWISWDVTNDVADFASGDLDNYGWIIKDEQYWGHTRIPNAYCRSKEQGTNAPYLEVEALILKSAVLIGRIEQLNTQGTFITFNAVKLRVITFSPFSINTYTQGETITIAPEKLGILNTNFAFGFFQIGT